MDFATAYAEGIMAGIQPGGIHIGAAGSFGGGHQGTGTGWFPAAPVWADNCNETCCISDMLSIAALLGRSGHAEYFDYVERYLRNYISNLQFIITPEFEAYYRKINAVAGKAKTDRGLMELRKF